MSLIEASILKTKEISPEISSQPNTKKNAKIVLFTTTLLIPTIQAFLI